MPVSLQKNTDDENFLKKKPQSKRKHCPKSDVYKCLSHHYVLKRSIVFIVDTDFSNDIYKQMAANHVCTFFNSMSPTDCFGYISLGKESAGNEILLEPKQRNTYIKNLFLKSMKKD